MRKRPFTIPIILISAALLSAGPESPFFSKKRQEMVDFQVKSRGIQNTVVLSAVSKVKRHLFVPDKTRHLAYEDRPLSIGYGQTISQPYMVAAMTAAIDPKPEDRVLEIGTGSGYQAAILAEIVKHVYTIEIIPELAEEASQRLSQLNYENITVKAGDGFQGWEEHAPFDAIVVTAAPTKIPPPLIKQLKVGGRMVIPVGSQEKWQNLKLVEKNADGSVTEKDLMPVRFVPFTGEQSL